jgi:hypothetical protein
MTKDEEIAQLKEDNANLRKLVVSLRQSLSQYQSYTARQYSRDSDYLPYQDDERRD